MYASIAQSMIIRSRHYVCVALCCMLGFAETASAQQYATMPPKLTGGVVKSTGRKAKSALNDAANFQANKQAINQYFGQYVFPGMTNYTPTSLGLLAKKRESLLRAIRGAKVPAAQKQLVELSRQAMQSFSRGNYHPAVRYNAVLVLGALDEKLATDSAPPVPLAAATTAMIELLENDSFKDIKVPTSVKLGALVGLERHALCGVAQEQGDKITQLALKIMAQEEPPADVTTDVHHWMKCQAARLLTQQHAKKATPELNIALTKMINDMNLSIEDRCCVADLLFRVNYEGAEGIDGGATVMALGNLAKQVISDEANLADEYEEARMSRRRSRVQPTYQRSRLASRLRSIGRGGTSLKKALPEEGQTQINNLLAPIAPVMNIAADKNNVDLNVTEAVKNLKAEIHAVVDSWGKAGEGEDAAEEDFS